MNWRELCSAIDSDYRLDYEQYLLDVLQDTKKAQAKASYEAGVKAEHERVNKCIKFIKYDQDTIAIIDMMQFECPEKCPKKEAIIKDAAQVTGIWDRGDNGVVKAILDRECPKHPCSRKQRVFPYIGNEENPCSGCGRNDDLALEIVEAVRE